MSTYICASCHTVYQLLLRQTDELFVFYKVGPLHSSSGGESPTGTTIRSLVLDRSYSALFSPVFAFRHISKVSRLQGFIRAGLRSESVHHGGKLAAAEVAEVIQGKVVSVNSLNVKNDVKLYGFYGLFFTSSNSLLCFSMAALFSIQTFILKLSS